MCIRDRLLYAFDPLPAGEYQLWVHGAQVGGESSTVNLDITCLLYTSDAADERSSVDLGGRRIIKKKNSSDQRDNPLLTDHNYQTNTTKQGEYE